VQTTLGTKVNDSLVDGIRGLAQHEGKTVSMLIKDSLRAYAIRHSEALLVGLESGALKQVENHALSELRVYRDVASRFGESHDSVRT
jgi:hypothetical protein